MRAIFDGYYEQNFWSDDESASGHGSNLKQTSTIREKLPTLFAQLGIRSLLDIPCGDFNWFSKMKLPPSVTQYIGGDIVHMLIDDNRERYPDPFYEFQVYDITCDRLPKVDLVLCRDLLGHLSNADVKAALQNLRASGSTYLLSTTFPKHKTNGDIRTGEWRPINLASFYGLPSPTLLLNEGCTEGDGKFADKSLGLWKLQGGR